MRKLLSVLLMVALLACLSAAAFAAKSPSQDVPVGTPAEEEPVIKDVEIVAENDIVFDEDCAAVVGTDGLDDADEETQEAVKALDAQKKDAVKALTPENLTKALDGDKVLLKTADGLTAVCTNPQVIWSKEGDYPCFVKYIIDHPVDIVLLFIDGVWTEPADFEIVENEDGTYTVSFTLEEPALYTDVWFK